MTIWTQFYDVQKDKYFLLSRDTNTENLSNRWEDRETCIRVFQTKKNKTFEVQELV